MKFNRKVLIYVSSWARLKGVSILYHNGLEAGTGIVKTTDWKLINEPDIFDFNYDKNVVTRGVIDWDLVIEEPLEMANKFINHFEKKLAWYVGTDEAEAVYPKIMTPNEYEDKLDRLKRTLNTLYGRGVICNELRHKALYTPDEVEHLIKARSSNTVPKIEHVIFNEPATIVFWKDGTKTVVKAQDGEEYDPEKGLAMAISKKAMGNNRDYYLTFKKCLKKYEKQYPELPQISFEEAMKRASEAAYKTSIAFDDHKKSKSVLRREAIQKSDDK